MEAIDNFERNVFYKVREAIQAEEVNCRKHASIVGGLVFGSKRVSIAHHIGEQEQLAREISKGIAEISFKEGQDARLEDAREVVKVYIEDIKKAGRKEVVDAVSKMIIRLKAITLPSEHRLMNELEMEWSKLKEWGL